jgi:cardiolipin synthase
VTRPAAREAPVGTPDHPSDAVLTLPNLVTFARLALIPLFLWLALGADQLSAAIAVGFVLGSTDWVDGKLARRLRQVSRFGIAIDPLFDRLAVAAGAAVIVARHLAPLPAVVIVLVRDAALLAFLPILAARGVPRPEVTFVGKAGSFGVMWAFGLFLAAGAFEPAAAWLRALAWACYVPGVILAYIAAVGYARTAVASLAAARRSRAAG